MRKPLTSGQDAFGHAMLDHFEGRGGSEIIERSDGYIDVSAGGATYFAEPHGLQRDIADRARGRVLDVGCGAGRYALYLQSRRHEVVGIDASPLCVEICRRRGLREVHLLTLDGVTPALGTFDTVLMLGNNFGLVASRVGAMRTLRRLRRIIGSKGRLIAETMDPQRTEDPDHLAYHAWNRERGRMAGQIRMRVRYKRYRTPWFDYLFVSRTELAELVSDAGWRIEELIDADERSYAAVLVPV